MRNSKYWAIMVLGAVSFTFGTLQATASEESTDIKSSIAKELLYGEVERSAYKWGDTSAARSDATLSKAARETSFSDWQAPSSTRKSYQREGVAVVEQSSFKWGVQSTVDQSAYKWGVRSTADQSAYKWGIRSTADQSAYKWGIRSTADQSAYKWGIRSTADQSAYKWGIR